MTVIGEGPPCPAEEGQGTSSWVGVLWLAKINPLQLWIHNHSKNIFVFYSLWNFRMFTW